MRVINQTIPEVTQMELIEDVETVVIIVFHLLKNLKQESAKFFCQEPDLK